MKTRRFFRFLSLFLLLGLLLPIPARAAGDAEILERIEAEGLPAGVSPDDPMWFKETHPLEWLEAVTAEDPGEGIRHIGRYRRENFIEMQGFSESRYLYRPRKHMPVLRT